MTIKDKISLLEKYYGEFFGEDNVRDFFMGLVDYLDLLESFPEYSEIRDTIYADRKANDNWNIKIYFDVKREVKLWHELEKLYLIRNIIKSETGEDEDPGSAVWNMLALPSIVDEWKRMKTGTTDYSLPVIFFNRQAIEPIVRRLHRYVVAKLHALVGDTEQTIICVDETNCALYKRSDPKSRCQFKPPRGGTNRRFEYILKIAKTKVGVPADRLYPGNYQALSTEIKNINTRIKNDLKLTDDIIVNLDNTGYRINELYRVEIV